MQQAFDPGCGFTSAGRALNETMGIQRGLDQGQLFIRQGKWESVQGG
jgi:hypothetical protein